MASLRRCGKLEYSILQVRFRRRKLLRKAGYVCGVLIVLFWTGSCLSNGLFTIEEPHPSIDAQKTGAPTPDEYPTESECSKYQSYDFTEVDRHTRAAPELSTRSIESLAEYLAGNAKNDLEKIRALSLWIAENIRYDSEAFRARVQPNQDALAVLRSRTAVCEGYSTLFLALAKQTGIEARKVTGYMDDGTGVAKTEDYAHAWDAVRIGGKWFPLDCTAASHYCAQIGLEETPPGYRVIWKEYEEYYLLASPRVMIFDHFPGDSAWQLLENPVTWEAFEKSIRPSPLLLRYGLSLDSLPFRSRLLIARSGTRFTLPVPMVGDLYDFDAGLFLIENGKFVQLYHNLIIQPLGRDRCEVLVLFPRVGLYLMDVWAKKRGNEKGDLILSYTVDAKEAETEGVLPVLFGDARKFTLETPLSGELHAGKEYEFRVRSDITTKIFVEEDLKGYPFPTGSPVYFTKDGDLYRGVITPRKPGHQVHVYFETSESSSGSLRIYEYEVVE
jgi:hypothetical protein